MELKGVKLLGIVLSILLIASLIVVSIVKKNNKIGNSIVLLLIMLLIPGVVNAIDTIKLTMTVKVEIESGYRVGYMFGVYMKESDRDKYDLRYAECDKEVYIGEEISENKYLGCSDIILWDDDLYSAGERVNLKINEYFGIDIYQKDQNNNYLCNYQNDNKIVCQSDVRKGYYDINEWLYSERIMNSVGLLAFDNDKNVMNFNSYYYDDWNDNRSFIVRAPQSFIMPAHTVLFYHNPSK